MGGIELTAAGAIKVSDLFWGDAAAQKMRSAFAALPLRRDSLRLIFGVKAVRLRKAQFSALLRRDIAP